MSVVDYTTPLTPSQRSCYPAPFIVAPANLCLDQVCAHATSLLARVVADSSSVLIGLGCKRWTCRFCAQVKIKRLSWLCARAEPTRLLTLTVDNKLYKSPREAFDRTRAFVPELIRALRVRFGEVEYLRVTECTKKGWPHYHLLVRSGFLPHKVVQHLWEAYTGATIVDLRQVTKAFGAYHYLAKYLTKMHNIDWTERHVSYSRAFFKKNAAFDSQAGTLGDYQIVRQHPYEWLSLNCDGMTLMQQAPMRWKLNGFKPLTEMERPDGF